MLGIIEATENTENVKQKVAERPRGTGQRKQVISFQLSVFSPVDGTPVCRDVALNVSKIMHPRCVHRASPCGRSKQHPLGNAPRIPDVR